MFVHRVSDAAPEKFLALSLTMKMGSRNQGHKGRCGDRVAEIGEESRFFESCLFWLRVLLLYAL